MSATNNYLLEAFYIPVLNIRRIVSFVDPRNGQSKIAHGKMGLRFVRLVEIASREVELFEWRREWGTARL